MAVVALVATAALTLGVATPAGADDDNATTGARSVKAVFECVAVNADGTFTALFGSSNAAKTTVNIPAGSANNLTPDVGATPPTSFAPGRSVGTFKVTWNGNATVVWHLPGGDASAKRTAKACNTAPVVSEARNNAILAIVAAAVALWWFNRRRARLLADT